jgi:hypothetical protein
MLPSVMWLLTPRLSLLPFSHPPCVQAFKLPRNVRATTDASEAIAGASYAVHAVPVQHSRAFLSGIRDVLPPKVPIVCVSKGLEVGSGCMMSEVIPGALGRRQPAVFISGPSFAKEVMQVRPGGKWGLGLVWKCASSCALSCAPSCALQAPHASPSSYSSSCGLLHVFPPPLAAAAAAAMAADKQPLQLLMCRVYLARPARHMKGGHQHRVPSAMLLVGTDPGPGDRAARDVGVPPL